MFVLFRPHCNTTFVYAVYCYKRSSVVCLSVCLSRSWALQKPLNRSTCRLGWGLGLIQHCIRWGCTLAPPGKHHWTVYVRRRYSGSPH